MILPWLLYPSRKSLVKLVSYHSGSCTVRIDPITVCEALVLSEGEIHISTRRRAPSSQHNCGLSENPGTIDWPPAARGELPLSYHLRKCANNTEI